MKNRMTQTLTLAVAAGLAAFAFTGCINNEDATDPTTDGGNVVIKQEADNMGTVLDESASSSGAVAKVSAVADSAFVTDSITGERILVRLHPDSGCQCYIRSAQFTSSVGFERQRLDSIWLDSSGLKLTGLPFRPAHADSITHIRHVTRINDNTGREIDLLFSTTLTKKSDSGATVFDWTGTITGTFNGVVFRNTTINVVRDLVSGQIGPAASGSIEMQRGNYVVQVAFSKSGSSTMATCTVTKNGVLVRTTHIDTTGKET